MAKKLRVVLISTLFAIFVFSLAGCKLGTSLEDVIKNNNLEAVVSYYANGGVFETGLNEKNIYYQSGSVPLNLGAEGVSVQSGSVSITKIDYDFVGWYDLQLKDGESPYDENGKLKIPENEKPMNFSVALASGDHWYVYAKWVVVEMLNFVLVTEDGGTMSVTAYGNTKDYANGDLLNTQSFKTGAVQRPNNPVYGTVADYTFVDYYVDKECTERPVWPIAAKGGDEPADTVIYAKYIPGKWTIIKDATDFAKVDFSNAKASYYLYNDIDCSGINYVKSSTFACTFEGNGHKVKNLSVKFSQTETRDKISAFGRIESGAKMLNVTFENLNVTYTANEKIPVIEAYLFAYKIDEGATITGVTVTGKLTLNTYMLNGNNVTVENLDDALSNWLVGGFETDEAALAAWTGINMAKDDGSVTLAIIDNN